MRSSKSGTERGRILLAGPTAVGKTELSLAFAEKHGMTVISADSRQCYRGLDVGTGKVSAADRSRVPHRNIDILDLTESDSAAAFARRAKEWEAELPAPVFYAGGSTLHLQSVVWPLNDLPEGNAANLAEIASTEDAEGPGGILKRLRAVDPDYAARMQGYNRQRAFRALDVWMQTGRPFSSFHRQEDHSVPEGTVVVVLTASRELLQKRIRQRVDAMMQAGFLNEVERIMATGIDPKAQSLQSVGYRELIEVVQGRMRHSEAVEAIRLGTRQYAKRQLTWFRRWNGTVWIERDGLSEAELLSRFESAIHLANS